MRTSNNPISTIQRLMDIKSAANYVGLGVTKTAALMDDIGATRRIGRRKLFDKDVIDKYLDALGKEN